MLRSERAATRVASLRATRALASRRGHLARRKIGVPAFVEALWALVAPDARASGVASPDAVADPPNVAGDAPSAGGGIAVGDPEASPDEAEETEKDDEDDEATTTTTATRPRRNVDARSRFHALRALIAIVSASWRGAELLVGGAPDTSRGARAPAFHRDLSPLARLVRPAALSAPKSNNQCETSDAERVGAATREKAARLLFLLARTAHGRAALCHEEGANLPDALAAAVEAGGALRGPETEETEEAEEAEEAETEAGAADAERRSPNARRATLEKKTRLTDARVAATCARLLGSLESSQTHDPAFETVAIAADAARTRAATGMYELFFRAPPEVPAAARAVAGEALAKLVAADARAAEACVASGALAAIAAALPAADRLERDGTSDLGGDASANTLFAEAFGAGHPHTRETSVSRNGSVRGSDAFSDAEAEETPPRRDTRMNVPATASFAAAALGLLEALAAHAFAREAAREFERERKKKGEMFSWAWTLLHQAMPAAGAEADASASAPPADAGTPEAAEFGSAKSKRAGDETDAGAADPLAGAPAAPAAAAADGADPAGEGESEDVVDAGPSSQVSGGDDGDAGAAAAGADPASSLSASPFSFPERFARFPPRASALTDGRDFAGTEERGTGEATDRPKEEHDAMKDDANVRDALRDWRALRARGLASAARLDFCAEPADDAEDAADDFAFRFVPGDAPWNDPEVCAAALRALDALARDDGEGTPGRHRRRGVPGERCFVANENENENEKSVAAALAREGGAGARFLEAALAASTRSRRFFACVEPAARLLAARAEAEAASAADARARGLSSLERLERRLDGAPRENGDASENAPGRCAARGTELLPSSRALAGLVLESEKNLFGSAALRGVLASALASEQLDLESLPRRPRVSESTAAPPPTPPAARSRFTPASLRGALLAGSSRATAAAFAAAAAGTVPAEELLRPPAEGQDAGELVEVVTVR